MEAIRCQYTPILIDPADRVRIIDSAPIPTYIFAHIGLYETVHGPQCASVMASKNAKPYGHHFIHLTAALRRNVRNHLSAEFRRFLNHLRRRMDTAFSVMRTVSYAM